MTKDPTSFLLDCSGGARLSLAFAVHPLGWIGRPGFSPLPLALPGYSGYLFAGLVVRTLVADELSSVFLFFASPKLSIQ